MPLLHRGRWFWESFAPEDRWAPAALADLRKAVTQEAGAVPELWRYYRVIVPDSEAHSFRPSAKLTAEHVALGLFGVHQQSQRDRIMHNSEVELGKALSNLRASGRYSPEALDRRVNAAATSTSTRELVLHLRGLVTQLRAEHQPLNYNRLVEDIYQWDYPDQRKRVRRRWGADYLGWANKNGAPAHDINDINDIAAIPSSSAKGTP
jgi:CRISPR system Cascade subunit CasB